MSNRLKKAALCTSLIVSTMLAFSALGNVSFEDEAYQSEINPVNCLLKVAEKENVHPNVFLSLGDAYKNGLFAPVDYAQSVKWYTKAAEAGSARGQLRLGLLYYKGLGTKEDVNAAFKWFLKAAEQNSILASSYVAQMYYTGQGTKQNYDEAFKWAEKASKIGIASEAQVLLGLMYYKGKGTEKDLKKALYWTQRSAALWNPDALLLLGTMCYDKKDYKKALECFDGSSQQGNTAAQIKLAMMYYNGKGCKKDGYGAAYWIKAAILQGSEKAKELYEKYNLDVYKINE